MSKSKEAPLSQFEKRIEALEAPEEKLKASIDFMQSALASAPKPNFKEFWDVRKQALPFFKDLSNPAMRSSLWEEYIELTKEGRRLKEERDTEATFVTEQIDLAIAALTKELDSFQGGQGENASLPEIAFPKCSCLDPHKKLYHSDASRLSALNVFAERIHSLRKELVVLETRISQKNKLFSQLSALGDQVFPLRKQIIQEASARFSEDVAAFVAAHFGKETFSRDAARGKVFFLRDQIKALQAVAKLLTLQSAIFLKTRTQLSGCWDQLKGLEKEFKQDAAEHRQKSKENVALVQQKIDLVKEEIKKEACPLDSLRSKIDEIAKFMRKVDLVRDDVVSLKEALKALKAPLEKQEQEQRALKEQERQERAEAQAKRFLELKGAIETLNFSEDASKELSLKIKESELSKEKKEKLTRQLKAIASAYVIEQEKRVLENLSATDKEAVDKLTSVLAERKERRSLIKAHIDELGKQTSSSGLDFGKAIELSEQIEEEKKCLSQLEEGILEIEQKLGDIKAQADLS